MRRCVFSLACLVVGCSHHPRLVSNMPHRPVETVKPVGAEIVIQIVTEDGHPLANARIVMTCLPEYMPPDWRLPEGMECIGEGVTGADGNAIFPNPTPGYHQFNVNCGDFWTDWTVQRQDGTSTWVTLYTDKQTCSTDP